MMSAFIGFVTTISGILLTAFGIILWLVERSRDPECIKRAELTPMSLEGISVQIGKLADIYIMSRPLFRKSVKTSHRTGDISERTSIIDNYHRYFGREESALIRPGYIVTIDISHKLHPILLSLGSPTSFMIVSTIGSILLIYGPIILYLTSIIGGQLLAALLLVNGLAMFIVVKSYAEKDSFMNIMTAHYQSGFVTLEIDGLIVRVSKLFGRGHTSFKNISPLKFSEVDRGQVTGIALDDGNSPPWDVFIFHKGMDIDDLSPDKLSKLIEQLNKCLIDARNATMLPLN